MFVAQQASRFSDLHELSGLVCTITASTANLLAAGTCGIEAKQLGNVTYQPATPLGRIFTVTAH